MKTVVSPEWVNDNRTGLIALDASWYMPNATDKKSEAELKALHILPHTRRFDVDEVADKTQVSSSKDPKYTPKDAKPLPHMLPSREEFIKHAKKLRIKPSDKIVVYSANGFLASARAWWMLKLFGFDQVYVLDGGLASWTSAGIPFAKDTTEDSDYGIQSLKESDYDGNDIKFRSELLVTLDDILDLVETLNSSKSSSASIPPAFILDARSKGRFDATQPEPRAGIRGGHIPGSLNAPFQDFLDPKTGTILPVPALKEAFLAVHPQLDKSVLSKVVYSCGTGVTAAITALAAHEAGFPDPIVYDGSWTEYGGLPNVPIEP